MYKKHQDVTTPDKNKVVWKYMELWKFLDLIDSSKLYLRRVDLFDDKYEGRYFGDDPVSDELSSFDEHRKNISFITCFTMDQMENYSMWKIYSDLNYGIALKTNIDRLIKSFEMEQEEVFIGEVSYKDSTGLYPINFDGAQVLKNYFIKRKYFDFEKEVRIFTAKNQNKEDLKGLSLNVDLEVLIEDIYISPFAKPSLKKFIEIILQSKGLNYTLKQSKI